MDTTCRDALVTHSMCVRGKAFSVKRATMLAVLGTAVFVAACARLGLVGASIYGDPMYLVTTGVAFAAMLVLWRLRPTGWLLALVIAGGLAGRLLMLPFPATDDVNRYLWDGRIQLAGFDPFALPPDASALAPLRSTLWLGMTHRELLTPYWPFAQMLFRLAAALGDSPMAWKLIMLAFDIGIAALLIPMLRRRGRGTYHVLLYWLNPLVLVYSSTGGAHLEVVIAFLVVAALAFSMNERFVGVFAMLALAVMTKATALLFVPLVIDRRNLRHAWVLLLAPATFLLYPAGAVHALSSPLAVARDYAYNGLVETLLRVLLPLTTANTISFAIMAVGLTAVIILTPDPIRAFRNGAAVFLLCSPTVHPWYFLVMTPFLALMPSPAWLVLHLTALPLVFFYDSQAQGAFWHARWLLFTLEYVPFVLTAIGVFVWRNLRQPQPCGSRMSSPMSVVIPTLNEADQIADCVATVRADEPRAEVIVVDGGSEDGTVERASGLARVRVVTSAKGRGVQIREGVRQATGEIVAVVHADSRLFPGTLARIAGRLDEQPDLVGGACGAHYDSHHVRFRFTEFLNSIRLLATGISFGDQVQFFRRAAFVERMPALQLMEDVEIAMQIKAAGEVGFVPHGVLCSTRRWAATGFVTNFVRVVRLTSAYLVRRRLGLLSQDCDSFYRRYYGA